MSVLSDKFHDLAREPSCDEDKALFEEVVQKVTTARPNQAAQKPNDPAGK